MKKKKTFLKHSIFIFLFCIICHFFYSFFPNFFTSIFFPVNESIFEHLKMLATAEVIFSISMVVLKKEAMSNFFLRTFLRIYLAIFILLILYLPCYYLFKEVMLFTFIILWIAIFVTESIVSFLNEKKHYSALNFMSVFFIIGTYILFTYFTYHPPKENLFLDPMHNKYGIDILNK